MAPIIRVQIAPLPPDRFSSVISEEQFDRFGKAIKVARKLFEGKVVWNINSTSRGGGVAEMLRSLIAYGRGAGVDVRWVVIGGNPDFFQVTKRIHNHLHGVEGDGGDLADAERRIYESALLEEGEELQWLVRDGDAVICHDPQTAGLIPFLKEAGARVIWRCHVGLDLPNELSRKAWRFLIPFVEQADAYAFSRKAHMWEGLEEGKLSVIPPSIDAFSAKNQDLDEKAVDAILKTSKLVDADGDGHPSFTREDGSPGRVDRQVEFFDGQPPPPGELPIVLQVSRWDRLKDPLGVLKGFADHVAPNSDAHLIYAGPSAESVFDDPEGQGVIDESLEFWQGLPQAAREKIHLAGLPMEDVEENAVIVNAIQRRADVVVQKSLAEGFGLTVAEAMWKARPVVASRIGGIQDQIEDGVTGVLLDDPTDLETYGGKVLDLLKSNGSSKAEEMGREAQKRVRDGFLGPRHLMQWIEAITDVL